MVHNPTLTLKTTKQHHCISLRQRATILEWIWQVTCVGWRQSTFPDRTSCVWQLGHWTSCNPWTCSRQLPPGLETSWRLWPWDIVQTNAKFCKDYKWHQMTHYFTSSHSKRTLTSIFFLQCFNFLDLTGRRLGSALKPWTPVLLDSSSDLAGWLSSMPMRRALAEASVFGATAEVIKATY